MGKFSLLTVNCSLLTSAIAKCKAKAKKAKAKAKAKYIVLS